MAAKHRIRITGGLWRGRWVDVPEGDNLRPTKSMIREMVFNWLGNELHGCTCVDLFAGTGIMGFEALSRGAHRCLWVERDAATCQVIEQGVARLMPDVPTQVQRGDVLSVLTTLPDLEGPVWFYADPPYDWDVSAYRELLTTLQACAQPNWTCMLEHPSQITCEGMSDWQLVKHRAHGRTSVTWLSLPGSPS